MQAFFSIAAFSSGDAQFADVERNIWRETAVLAVVAENGL
jgi:hypothetical protein